MHVFLRVQKEKHLKLSWFPKRTQVLGQNKKTKRAKDQGHREQYTHNYMRKQWISSSTRFYEMTIKDCLKYKEIC